MLVPMDLLQDKTLIHHMVPINQLQEIMSELLPLHINLILVQDKSGSIKMPVKLILHMFNKCLFIIKEHQTYMSKLEIPTDIQHKLLKSEAQLIQK